MKNKSLTQASTVFALLTFFLLSFTSCSKDKDNPDLPLLKTNIQFSGANEVPANGSSGTGTGQITFDQASKKISFNVKWTLGLPTANTTDMHFHGSDDGTATKNSPVVIEIDGWSTTSSGSLSGTTRVLSDAEVNQLKAGKWYMNIHSSTAPGGELRANILFK
jgi:hypothetical protein